MKHEGGRERGLAALIGATLLWGVTFTLVGNSVEGRGLTGALTFLAVRFGIASASFLLVLRPLARELRRADRRALRDGIFLGAMTFAGFLTQTLGLLDTTPARSAFVTSLSVVFVPFAAALWLRRRVSGAHLLLSLLALAGVALVVAPEGSLAPNRGDFWTLACAVAFAGQIVALEGAARHTSSLLLTVGLILTTAVCAWIGLFLVGGLPLTPWPSLYPTAAVTGVVCTSLCLAMVAYGQTRVASETAALIFSLEPIFAALFDGLWSGRWLSAWQCAGGAVVLSAALGAARLEARR